MTDSLTPRVQSSITKKGRRAKGRPSAWLTGDFHVDEKDTLPEFPWASSASAQPSLKLSLDEAGAASRHRLNHRPPLQGKKREERRASFDNGPGYEGVGVRVAIYWVEERRSFAGTVTRYNPMKEEYLVEYEDDDTEAWHPWNDIRNILPERSPKLRPSRSPQHQKALSGLDMLADTVRGDHDHSRSSDGSSDGLFALSEIAQREVLQPAKPVNLKTYAQNVEKQVNYQLKGLTRKEIAPGVFGDAMSEIKDIVMQAIESTKGNLGHNTVITTMALG